MPIDGPQGFADEDPYLTWARAAQQQAVTPGAPGPALPPPLAPPPIVTPPPGAPGLPSGPTDPYPAWASAGPVTMPGELDGPITAPSQAAPAGDSVPAMPGGPITSPDSAPAVSTPDALGKQNPFGGDVDPIDRAKAIGAMTPEDRAAAVQSMTPDEFVGYKARRNAATLLRQSELEHQAIIDSERRAREDLEMQRAATAKAAADTKDMIARADAIVNTKIDPGRYVRGLRAGGHFGTMVVLAGLGGLVSRSTGGRNLVLDEFDKGVERDIAAQHEDIQNRWRAVDVRKGAIGEEYARTGDLYKASETYRIAAYQSAINSMQSTLQQFDPAGGTAVSIRDTIDQFHAAQAQSISNFAQQQLKNHLDVSEQERKRAETASVIAKNQAETAKLYAEAAKEKAGKKEGTTFSPEQLKAINGDNPVPPIPMTLKEYETWLGGQQKGQEIKNKSLATTNAIPSVKVKAKGGKEEETFVATGGPEELAKLRAKVAASGTMTHLLDQALRIRTGYSNNNVDNRKEWQQLQEIWGALKARGKDALGLGALSGDDYKLLEAYLGSPDPTQFRDPTEGIKQARRTVMLDLNDTLHAQGYPEDQSHEILDTSKPPTARNTGEDRAVKQVLDKSTNVRSGNFTASGDVVPAAAIPTIDDALNTVALRRYGVPFGRLPPIERRLVEAEVPVAMGQAMQHRQLDAWGEQLRSPDPATRSAAAQHLAEAAGTDATGPDGKLLYPGANESAIREYARQILVGNSVADLPDTPEVVR